MTVYQFLTICDTLKRVQRTGWLLRGIPPTTAENVAGHSHTTTILSYILANQGTQKVDISRVLIMALIHDLPEAIIGDIPISAQRVDTSFPQAKEKIENLVMQKILANLPDEIQSQLLEIWTEYLKGETYEARLVEAADRLATVLHASQLVKSGYTAELFTTFLDHAESIVAKLQIPLVDELVKELHQIIGP